MAEGASLSGHVQVRLGLEAGQIQSVQVDLQRPLASVSRLVVGQTPEQFVASLPLLFSLCAAAHQTAALEALERAMGWQAPLVVQQARQQRVALERIKEAAIRLVQTWHLPWPVADLKQLMQLCGQASQFLRSAVTLRATTATLLTDQLIQAIQQHGAQLIDQASDLWLQQQSLAPSACAGRAARVWPEALQLNASDWQQLMPELRAGRSKAELAGQPRITGPAIGAGTTDSESLHVQQRLQAVLVQIQQDVQQLAHPTAAWDCPVCLESHEGVAVVQTTRGLLLHRLRLHGLQLSEWQMLAPTDWNFHPRGLLVSQLQGLRVAEDFQQTEAWVNTLIQSIDPCVAVQVVWENARA